VTAKSFLILCWNKDQSSIFTTADHKYQKIKEKKDEVDRSNEELVYNKDNNIFEMLDMESNDSDEVNDHMIDSNNNLSLNELRNVTEKDEKIPFKLQFTVDPTPPSSNIALPLHITSIEFLEAYDNMNIDVVDHNLSVSVSNDLTKSLTDNIKDTNEMDHSSEKLQRIVTRVLEHSEKLIPYLRLSKDMMDMLGYPNETEGYISTSSNKWKFNSNMNSFKKLNYQNKNGHHIVFDSSNVISDTSKYQINLLSEGGGFGVSYNSSHIRFHEQTYGLEEGEEGEIIEVRTVKIDKSSDTIVKDTSFNRHSSIGQILVDDTREPFINTTNFDKEGNVIPNQSEIEIEQSTEMLKVCAIDCEMCYTSKGLELTRVTVVCPLKGIVFDELVKPQENIINYNTEFSGITENDLKNVSVIKT
jgi:DNA polymerase III epsilon subunit-like protein